MLRSFVFAIFAVSSSAVVVSAADPAVERGRKSLEGTAFIRAFWPSFAYDQAWRAWGVKERPKDYDAAFRERYGLHSAPYPNGKYPMGLRSADYLVVKGLGIDCTTCHGGSIFGKSYVGLGNTALDIHSLFEELSAVSGNPIKNPFHFSQARGTSEAGAFAVYLLGMRKPDLSLDPNYRDLGLHDDAVEDVPAWWLLKKKSTMYYVGATDARSVRSIMQFMMHPLSVPKDFDTAEPAFRDIQQYILSLEPPKYPYPVDEEKVKVGRDVFNDNCAKCHGTYGDKPTYPNKIISLDKIGTDRKRFDNIGIKFGEAYNASWFAKESSGDKGRSDMSVKMTLGYQAPPLDGIWATAPYFHNGSVPTLDGVLNSKARPKVFTRSFRTGEEDYDRDKVGWKVREVAPPDAMLAGIEKRKTYDTTQPGRSNAGHTFGDHLTPVERRAVIEYLKTL